MSAKSGSPGYAMPIVAERRSGRLRRFLQRHDLYYSVPVAIAVAGFIIAVFAYFAGMH